MAVVAPGVLAGWPAVNPAPSATLAASTAATGYPVSNLATLRLGEAWRTTTTSGWVSFDFGASKTVGLYVLAGMNLTDAATHRLQHGNDATFVTNNLDTGSPEIAIFDVTEPGLISYDSPAGKLAIYRPGSGENPVGRYVKWAFTDSANPDGYIEAAVPILSTDEFLSVSDLSASYAPDLTVDGPRGFDRPISGVELLWDDLTRTEKNELISLTQSLGNTGRMVVLPRPGDPETWIWEAMLGTFAGSPRSRRAIGGDGTTEKWEVQIGFQQVLD